ncbi:guanylate kinase [Rickettsiales bacterium]|nr:guanylate kinase [Rickettsiales bacterium]MDB2550793.1 guanylate kinase [Rickettsiales bacterium]
MNIVCPPFLIIISSPSGAGKSTICNMLIKGNADVKLSISATTRQKRDNEIDGQDYFFVTNDEFEALKVQDQLLESANIFGNHYGTPKRMIDDCFSKNQNVLFDIDWQGARQLNQKFNKNKIISFFLLPPSMKELHSRLQKRAMDSEDVVKKRMFGAIDEISHFNEYDYVLVNEDLQQTYDKINDIIHNPNQSIECDLNSISDFANSLKDEWHKYFN